MFDNVKITNQLFCRSILLHILNNTVDMFILPLSNRRFFSIVYMRICKRREIHMFPNVCPKATPNFYWSEPRRIVEMISGPIIKKQKKKIWHCGVRIPWRCPRSVELRKANILSSKSVKTDLIFSCGKRSKILKICYYRSRDTMDTSFRFLSEFWSKKKFKSKLDFDPD